MPKRTTDFREDLLDDLADAQEAAHYLNAAFEDSDEMFLVALRDVAEARQMAKVAEAAGVARESLYRMLTGTGNPTFSNLLGILRAVGLKITIAAESSAQTHDPSRLEANDLAKTTIRGGPALDAANETLEDRHRIRAANWVPRKEMNTAVFLGATLPPQQIAGSVPRLN